MGALSSPRTLNSSRTIVPSFSTAQRCVFGEGGGDDLALDGEDFAGGAQGLLEGAGDLFERGEEEVAEAHAGQPAILEAVLEEVVELPAGLVAAGERDEAVARVAGRQHAQVAPQLAGTAAGVGDGDDGGQVVRVRLQPLQDHRQAGAAADGEDARLLAAPAVGCDEDVVQFADRA